MPDLSADFNLYFFGGTLDYIFFGPFQVATTTTTVDDHHYNQKRSEERNQGAQQQLPPPSLSRVALTHELLLPLLFPSCKFLPKSKGLICKLVSFSTY